MSELQTYPNPRYIGSDNDIECETEHRDDETFTISAAKVTLYDSDGDLTLGPIADGDGRFDIDGVYLRYQLDLGTGAYSGDLYLVVWEYTSSGKIYKDQFILEIRDVPH